MSDPDADPDSARRAPDTGASAIDAAVDSPRGDVTREWDLFVREETGDPLCHAGSISAPTADIAREQAERLFGWTAETLWLCPANETRRFAADGVSLGERADGPETGADSDENEGERA